MLRVQLQRAAAHTMSKKYHQNHYCQNVRLQNSVTMSTHLNPVKDF